MIMLITDLKFTKHCNKSHLKVIKTRFNIQKAYKTNNNA